MATETPTRTISLQMGAFGGPISGAQSFHPVDEHGDRRFDYPVLFMVPREWPELGSPERITLTITASG